MAYLPEAGDLVWVNFDPQAGREQAKNRPALVLTASEFNAATGLLVVCPITRTDRPWRTRVPLTGTSTSGFVMIEQLKSIDWQARGAAFIEHVPRSLFEDVKSRIATMLDL
ncbi:MAG: mRNA-degrading endonuclease [Acetobacteraceae bacterium]|nr:mRNA-degrading endonuclease [Acetobacteraceae bacterium]